MSRILVIPFFIPHAGCPFTCVFCNQWGISGETELAQPEGIEEKVREYLRTDAKAAQRIETAFFGGSFTGLPEEVQERWLAAAQDLIKKRLITGIRLSTRPDYINEKNLLMLYTYGVTTIELGVQSLVDEVLIESKRGYTSEAVVKATELIKRYPFDLVFQLMLGLPGDNRETAFVTAQRTIGLKPDSVRIYPTVVIKNTLLEKWHKEGSYQPWTLEQAIGTGAEWLGLFSFYKIPVIRMGLQATESLTPEQELVAGPYHPAFGELVESALMLQHMLSLLSVLSPADNAEPAWQELMIYFHPLDYSKVVGQKRTNIEYLKKRFSIGSIRLCPDDQLGRGDLRIKTDSQDLSKTRQEYLQKYRIKEWDA